MSIKVNLKFAHYLNHTVGELEYRLSHVIETCKISEARFLAQQEQIKGDGAVINYHFSAFSSLVQTFKDILPIVSGNKIPWSALSKVRHIDFIKNSRNAITHDGYPLINMWVDGLYYVACDFKRINGHGNIEYVKIPKLDIATICSEFSCDLATEVQRIILPIIKQKTSIPPIYDDKFYEESIEHPAIPSFAKEIYQKSVNKPSQCKATTPLLESYEKLGDLIETFSSVAEKKIEEN